MTTIITSAKNLMYARKSVRKYKEGVTIPQEVLHRLIEDGIPAHDTSRIAAEKNTHFI